MFSQTPFRTDYNVANIVANPYDFQQFNMPEIHFFILYQHSEIVEKTLSLLFPHRQKSAILIKY